MVSEFAFLNKGPRFMMRMKANETGFNAELDKI